jgi:hypothetical protein
MDARAAGQKAKKIAIRVGVGAVLLTVGGGALYTYGTLHYSYSEGERVGFVQKVSKKGWICKTDEGELAMANVVGQQAQIFLFTVRDDAVVAQIEALSGHRVALRYEEHRGIPSSCFGDTTYFVTAVRRAE